MPSTRDSVNDKLDDNNEGYRYLLDLHWNYLGNSRKYIRLSIVIFLFIGFALLLFPSAITFIKITDILMFS